MFSKFFRLKLEATDRFDNETDFNYDDYAQVTLKNYLDLVHGIEANIEKLPQLLELLRFLRYEGRASE